MLDDVQCGYDEFTARLERLKAEGKSKPATFRQYLGNKYDLSVHLVPLPGLRLAGASGKQRREVS